MTLIIIKASSNSVICTIGVIFLVQNVFYQTC